MFQIVSIIFTLQESKKPFYELMMSVTKMLAIGKHDLKAITKKVINLFYEYLSAFNDSLVFRKSLVFRAENILILEIIFHHVYLFNNPIIMQNNFIFSLHQ